MGTFRCNKYVVWDEHALQSEMIHPFKGKMSCKFSLNVPKLASKNYGVYVALVTVISDNKNIDPATL